MTKRKNIIGTFNFAVMNVNRFYKLVCKIGTAQLRGQIRPAANIRLKEILKGGIDRNTISGASIKQLWLYKQSCF